MPVPSRVPAAKPDKGDFDDSLHPRKKAKPRIKVYEHVEILDSDESSSGDEHDGDEKRKPIRAKAKQAVDVDCKSGMVDEKQ